MAAPVEWHVDHGHTRVRVRREETGTSISVLQGEDHIHLDATGASPGSLVEALMAAIQSVSDVIEFEKPDLAQFGYVPVDNK